MKRSFYFIAWLFMHLLFISACNPTSNGEQTSPQANASADLLNRMGLQTGTDGEIDTVNIAKIEFEELSYNFDTVFTGDQVVHKFKFSNRGKKDLYLLDTQSSCGCTVGEFTKDAIKPGESNVVNVTFDTKGKYNRQKKQIVIYTNTYPNKTILTLDGFVKNLN